MVSGLGIQPVQRAMKRPNADNEKVGPRDKAELFQKIFFPMLLETNIEEIKDQAILRLD